MNAGMRKYWNGENVPSVGDIVMVVIEGCDGPNPPVHATVTKFIMAQRREDQSFISFRTIDGVNGTLPLCRHLFFPGFPPWFVNPTNRDLIVNEEGLRQAIAARVDNAIIVERAKTMSYEQIANYIITHARPLRLICDEQRSNPEAWNLIAESAALWMAVVTAFDGNSRDASTFHAGVAKETYLALANDWRTGE